MKFLVHAVVCNVRLRWLRWRIGMPFWRDDETAKMLGIAQFGCPRCGRGAKQEAKVKR
jgi:hypothetical protein